MKPTTLAGLITGVLLTLGGGAAYAARKKKEGEDDSHFVYVMQPGDTLSDLAKKFYGDAGKAPLLFSTLDKLPDSQDQVPVGARLRVPCVWVTVQKGDTLPALAQRVLGDGKRWRRILEANLNASAHRLQDADHLAIGQKLAVPVEPAQGQAVPAAEKPAAQAPPSVSIGDDLDLLDAEIIGWGG